jgi:hypothetical protein
LPEDQIPEEMPNPPHILESNSVRQQLQQQKWHGLEIAVPIMSKLWTAQTTRNVKWKMATANGNGGRVPLIAPPFNQRRTSPMRNLNHERHIPDPVQSHNGRRISHTHQIAMDNFSYPDILCLGMERDLSQKYGQNETVRKMTDQQ